MFFYSYFLFVCLFHSLSLSLSIYLSIYLSICLSIDLSYYVYISLSLFHTLFFIVCNCHNHLKGSSSQAWVQIIGNSGAPVIRACKDRSRFPKNVERTTNHSYVVKYPLVHSIYKFNKEKLFKIQNETR